jgi:hypothetical protein
MKLFTFLILISLTYNSYALPKRVEVWFLSIDKTSWLDNLNKSKVGKKIAQRNLQCQVMGEYCFDPQVGLYKRGEEQGAQSEIDMAEIEKSQSYDFLEPHKGHERNMIECDENSNFFDIFCGKAKKKVNTAKTNLEVWVDVSSTMKQVDFDGFNSECKRERFLKDLALSCPINQKMKVYFFEEFRKEASTLDRVCLSGGLNNMKRIIQDIEKSKADNVIIITDIFEAEDTFISAIENTGRGIIKGLKEPIYAADLKGELQRVGKLCK